MSKSQGVRVVLFYLSTFVFIFGLPFIISFSLGYKFDPRKFTFTKAGLIAIKTQPDDAAIYLNGKLLKEKTPATINELLPGRYSIRLELEKHYPWSDNVTVEAGEVARIDKVILFPTRPNIKQLTKYDFSSFWIDNDAGLVYYTNKDNLGVFTSNLEGENFERVCAFLEIRPYPKKWLISEDRQRLLYFNPHQIGIAYLKPQNDPAFSRDPFVIQYNPASIVNAFWHSDNYHIVIVSNRGIEVIEARPGATGVQLVNLSKANTVASYDAKSDTLYFTDSQRASDGKLYDNLYKIQFNNKLFNFQEFMKLAPGLEKAKITRDGKEPENK